MRRALCFWLLALGFWLPSASAQTPAPAPIPKVEFDEAIRRALASNPTVAQATNAITRSELLVQQSKAVTRPTANARFTNLTLDDEVGFNGGVTQPQNQSTLAADFTLPLVDLSRRAAVTQARDQVDVSRLTTDTVRRDIALATAQTYLAIIASRRQVEVDERALENARAHLDYARRRVQGGAGTRVDELRADASTSTSIAQLENSRLGLRRAQEAMSVLIAADGPVDAGAEPAFDIPAAVSEQEWAQARPDVRLEQTTQRAAERVVRDSWRDFVGNAAATFTPQYVAPRGLFQPSRSWRFTVSFTQPLYEGGLRKAVLRLRELQVEQMKLEVSSVMLRARSEVRVASESLKSYELVLASARLAATQSADVLRITTSAFELGATTNIEVIDAQRATRDLESAASRAQDALLRAKLDYLVAIGRFPR